MEKSNEQKRAMERMEAELAVADGQFEKRIGAFILRELGKDPELAKRCEENSSTLKGACDYVMKEARKKANGSKSLCIEDKVVYGWVLHYVQDVEEKAQEGAATPKTGESPAPKAEKENKKAKKEEPKERNQMCLFDFFEEGARA